MSIGVQSYCVRSLQCRSSCRIGKHSFLMQKLQNIVRGFHSREDITKLTVSDLRVLLKIEIGGDRSLAEIHSRLEGITLVDVWLKMRNPALFNAKMFLRQMYIISSMPVDTDGIMY